VSSDYVSRIVVFELMAVEQLLIGGLVMAHYPHKICTPLKNQAQN
jgi:hypothetical protein